MMSGSSEAMIHRLYGHTARFDESWRTLAPSDSHLWELSRSYSFCTLLERDIIHIGTIFSAADALAARSEVYLTAECVTHLRRLSGEAVAQLDMERSIEQIGEHLLQQAGPIPSASIPIHPPLCYRIAQFLMAHRKTTEESLLAYRQCWLDLVHLFILRDGTITAEEDQRLKDFHAALDG